MENSRDNFIKQAEVAVQHFEGLFTALCEIQYHDSEWKTDPELHKEHPRQLQFRDTKATVEGLIQSARDGGDLKLIRESFLEAMGVEIVRDPKSIEEHMADIEAKIAAETLKEKELKTQALEQKKKGD